MADADEKGQVEADTARKISGDRPGGDGGDLLQQLLRNDEPDLPGLDLALDDVDVVAAVATKLNQQRRARGRPEGSANRRNAEVFDYLEARGFKAPELRLMEIISADTRALAAALAGPDVKPESVSFQRALAVLQLQATAAKDLMPYKYAKRNELKIDSSRTVQHLFVAGSMQQFGAKTGSMSLTQGAEQFPNEINGSVVREPDHVSHDDDNDVR